MKSFYTYLSLVLVTTPVTRISAVPVAGPLPITHFVAFGDSLTDNGNAFALSNQTWPSTELYFNGRFTNGLTWIEWLQRMYNATLTNWAYGGATTDSQFIPGTTGLSPSQPAELYSVPGVKQQITEHYLKQQQQNNNNDNTTRDNGGARRFLLISGPSFADSPEARLVVPSDTATLINQLLSMHDTLLRNTLDQYLIRNTKLDLTDVSEACLNATTSTLCPNPNQHYYYDDSNISGPIHYAFARSVNAWLQEHPLL
ncbi:hypothetical protein BDF22DRAFT_694438 [Syncephalis plumigaleata]|nr:hypothetical protein BDF22DRAFT_694438 [Syncephalis plumigaleata]